MPCRQLPKPLPSMTPPVPVGQEYAENVRKEAAYLAVEKNVSGSRPKELYEDCIEEVEGSFTKERATLKDAVKDHSISVSADSTLDEFVEALTAASVDLEAIIVPHRWGPLWARVSLLQPAKASMLSWQSCMLMQLACVSCCLSIEQALQVCTCACGCMLDSTVQCMAI